MLDRRYAYRMATDELPPMFCNHCYQQIVLEQVMDGMCRCGQLLTAENVLYEGDPAR